MQRSGFQTLPARALQPAILNPAPSNAAGPRTAPDTSEASPEPAAAAQDAIAPNSPVAHRYAKFIDPGQHVERLSPSDKVKLGLGAAFSPFSAFGWVSAATYSQALDSSPNYGQGWAPYGQRLGAAAARGTSEGIFSDSVFAPLFHEDPRYYRLGPGKPLVHRALYAVTRTVITRTDDRRTTPNFALLAGNAAGAILTNAYYPSINRNATTTVETFAGSVGGSALGFFVREFLSDTLAATHLRHTD